MAKTVNLGDPYTHRITLRLTDKQFDYLTKVSTIMGTSPSDYLRMSVNCGMVSMSNVIDTMASGKVGLSDENDEARKHNIVQQSELPS